MVTAISPTSKGNPIIKSVLLSVVLAIGAFLSALTVLRWSGFVVLALFAAASLLSRWFVKRGRGKVHAHALVIPSLLLGLSIPLINVFGSGTLLSIALLYAALTVLIVELSLAWALPWICILFFSAGAEIFWSASLVDWQFDAVSLKSISETFVAWHHFAPEWLRALVASYRWLALCVLMGIFSLERSLARATLRGLVVGSFIAVLILAYDYSIGRHSHLPEQELFWAGIGRFSGTFSDANAFGIVALLSVALLSGGLRNDETMSARRWQSAALMLLVTAAILLSGSRSLLLGLFVIVVMRIPLSRRAWALLLVSIALSYLVFARTPLTQFEGLLKAAPESIERVVRSVHPETASDALTSRWMFIRIGQRMWRDNPWWGVGLNRFPESVPEYARREGVVIGRWLDNSNNFYLGILAEMGILGFVALVVTVLAVRYVPRDPDVVWPRTVLTAFLIVLLVGPHLDFDEVAVMFALVAAGAGVTFSQGLDRRVFAVAAALIFPLMIAARASNSYGLFPFEFSTSGPFRWSETAARFNAVCDQNGTYSFSYLKPADATNAEGTIDLWVNGVHRQESAPPGERRTITLECPRLALPNSSIPLQIRLRSEGYFVPADAGATGDFRRLGLQLLYPPD